MTERRDGHRKLVWDKDAQRMTTVDPHPETNPATGKSFETAWNEVAEVESKNGEAFKAMASDIWAAGATLEEADFVTRMLARKGLYLFQTEPWKRCPSTHCERSGLCCSPRDCTIKQPAPAFSKTEG